MTGEFKLSQFYSKQIFKILYYYCLFPVFRAVEIMQACTATGEVELLVARDADTEKQFKKLSTSLYNTPLRKKWSRNTDITCLVTKLKCLFMLAQILDIIIIILPVILDGRLSLLCVLMSSEKTIKPVDWTKSNKIWQFLLQAFCSENPRFE